MGCTIQLCLELLGVPKSAKENSEFSVILLLSLLIMATRMSMAQLMIQVTTYLGFCVYVATISCNALISLFPEISNDKYHKSGYMFFSVEQNDLHTFSILPQWSVVKTK